MLIEKMDKKIKCDASGCKNLSEYKLVNKRITFNGSLYFCSNCLNELYDLLGEIITPKSPRPIFKKKDTDFINYSFFDQEENLDTKEKLEEIPQKKSKRSN